MDDWKEYLIKEVENTLRKRGVQFQSIDTLDEEQKHRLYKYTFPIRFSKVVMGNDAHAYGYCVRYHINYLIHLITVSMGEKTRCSTGVSFTQLEGDSDHEDKVMELSWTQVGQSCAIELKEQTRKQCKQKMKKWNASHPLSNVYRPHYWIVPMESIEVHRCSESCPGITEITLRE